MKFLTVILLLTPLPDEIETWNLFCYKTNSKSLFHQEVELWPWEISQNLSEGLFSLGWRLNIETLVPRPDTIQHNSRPQVCYNTHPQASLNGWDIHVLHKGKGLLEAGQDSSGISRVDVFSHICAAHARLMQCAWHECDLRVTMCMTWTFPRTLAWNFCFILDARFCSADQ